MASAPKLPRRPGQGTCGKAPTQPPATSGKPNPGSQAPPDSDMAGVMPIYTKGTRGSRRP